MLRAAIEGSVRFLIGVEEAAVMFSVDLDANRGGAPRAVSCICAVILPSRRVSAYEPVVPANLLRLIPLSQVRLYVVDAPV